MITFNLKEMRFRRCKDKGNLIKDTTKYRCPKCNKTHSAKDLKKMTKLNTYNNFIKGYRPKKSVKLIKRWENLVTDKSRKDIAILKDKQDEIFYICSVQILAERVHLRVPGYKSRTISVPLSAIRHVRHYDHGIIDVDFEMVD